VRRAATRCSARRCRDVRRGGLLGNLARVDGEDRRGSWTDPDDDSGDEGGLRGWIPPDDRLWRHPSELSQQQRPIRTGVGEPSSEPHRRTGALIVGGTTACLLLAVLAVGLAIAATNSAEPDGTPGAPRTATLTGTPTTEPGASSLAATSQIDSMVAAIRPSTVAVRVERSRGTTVTTGLVAEAGGIVVVASEALAGARAISVVEPDGTDQQAELLGSDRPTGLSVLRIGDDLPAAVFDAEDPSVGAMTVAVAMEPGRQSGDVPAPHVYGGAVVSSGRSLTVGSVPASFAATSVAAPLTSRDLGCILLDESGNVSGMLDAVQGTGSATRSIFLPGELVAGVVRQLVSSGVVDHGWFGVGTIDGYPPSTASTVAATTSPAAGASVTSVDADSPASAAGIEPGDLIIGLDGHRVVSAADLATRLYADPPGTALAVTVERAGGTFTTAVVLTDAGADAPGGGTSP
jgi:S1-C subfamily serine protease